MKTSTPLMSKLAPVITGLISLDVDAVIGVVEEACADGLGLAPVVTGLLVPAYEEVERRFRRGEMDSASLGVAATIVRRALARAVAATAAGYSANGSATAAVGAPEFGPVASRPRVAVICVPADADVILAEALSEVVRAAGWPADLLVTGPAEDDLAYQLRARPTVAVVVACHSAIGLSEMPGITVTAHGAGAAVIAVGRGFGIDGGRARWLGADAWAPAIDAVVETLAAWEEMPPVLADSSPPRPDDEYDAFVHEQVEWSAAATARLAQATGGGPLLSPWLEQTLKLLIAHLGVAVLLDDSGVLLDFLIPQLGRPRLRQFSDPRLVGVLDAVADVRPGELERSGKFLEEGRKHLRSSSPRPGRGFQAVGAEAAQSGDGDAEAPPGAPDATQGQGFADLLLLGAMACQAPLALVSVPQADGQWSTLSYGFERREGLNDPLLYSLIAARSGPVEFGDPNNTETQLAASPLVRGPHALRWIYGIGLRGAAGSVVGVFCVLDRNCRQATTGERRALQAVSRQLTGQLTRWRRASGPASAAWRPAPRPPAVPVDQPPVLVGLTGGTSIPSPGEGSQQLMRSHEVAVLFDVTERTVINWAASGKLPSLRTVGGHLRFRSQDVRMLLAGQTPDDIAT